MKPMNFKGRWVLVTGASSGLGAEMARQLAREHGAQLILVARRQDRLQELKAELSPLVRVETIVADLSDETAVARVIAEAEGHGPLYAAVLNAGATHFGHHDELTWEQFRKMLDLNVIGTVALTTRLLPLLEKRNENGGLLLIASLAGLTPVSYQPLTPERRAFWSTTGALCITRCAHEASPSPSLHLAVLPLK
jgi:short-subunit dehydrogenase